MVGTFVIVTHESGFSEDFIVVCKLNICDDRGHDKVTLPPAVWTCNIGDIGMENEMFVTTS